MIAVSACLAGVCCRYNAEHKQNNAILQLLSSDGALLVCPELLGGMPTPRPAATLIGGRVMGTDGVDYTEQYTCGAKKALAILQKNGITKVFLKSKSPSCGYGKIYNQQGDLIDGNGVFAQMLQDNGIEVVSVE